MAERLKPQIILLDRDLADGDWRSSLSACASASAGACTLLISRVADDYEEIRRHMRQLERIPHRFEGTSADDYCTVCGLARGYIEASDGRLRYCIGDPK